MITRHSKGACVPAPARITGCLRHQAIGAHHERARRADPSRVSLLNGLRLLHAIVGPFGAALRSRASLVAENLARLRHAFSLGLDRGRNRAGAGSKAGEGAVAN
jgi:hypothetical protein